MQTTLAQVGVRPKPQKAKWDWAAKKVAALQKVQGGGELDFSQKVDMTPEKLKLKPIIRKKHRR